MEKVKNKKRHQTDMFSGFNGFGKTEKRYSASELNNDLNKFTQKHSHYKFVVDWQLNNENGTIPQ